MTSYITDEQIRMIHDALDEALILSKDDLTVKLKIQAALTEIESMLRPVADTEYEQADIFE